MVDNLKLLKIITLKYKNTYVFSSIDEVLGIFDENLN